MTDRPELFLRLKRSGADPEGGLRRLLGDEGLFRDLLKEFFRDPDLSVLEQSLKENDFPTAFRAAHNLKGAAAVLGLTPVQIPLAALTEDLRGPAEKTGDTGHSEAPAEHQRPGSPEEPREVAEAGCRKHYAAFQKAMEELRQALGESGR